MVVDKEHRPIIINAKIKNSDGGIFKLIPAFRGREFNDGFTPEEVKDMILEENYDFLVKVGNSQTSQIIVKERDGKWYLATIGDTSEINNLDNLPEKIFTL